MSQWKKFSTFMKAIGSGSLIFTSYGVLTGNETIYDCLVLPLNAYLSPEISHRIAINACRYNIFTKPQMEDSARLRVKFLNFELSNPIGIAAGFDKHAEVPEKLHELGFGFVEIGSVTPVPQSGKTRPRVFRLIEDKAIINRYGFNSVGHHKVFDHITYLRKNDKLHGILGVNLGKNRITEDPVEDYVKGVKLFAPIADYLVVNVSSPNTPGLRDMQHKDILYNLLKSTIAARNELPLEKPTPIFLKLSPDLSKKELQEVANIIKLEECKVDGLIISNTTISRDPKLKSSHAKEIGGLSGAPLRNKSTKMIAEVYKLTEGKVPIIGVGGVSTGKDAYDKITAGATVVQLYSAFAYQGPFVVPRVKQKLLDYLEVNGHKSVNEAIGSRVDSFLD